MGFSLGRLQRFAKLISGMSGLGMFGLPQRGKGAEVAEIELILCSLCLSAPLRQSRRFRRLSNDSAVRGLMRFLEISSGKRHVESCKKRGQAVRVVTI